MRKYTIFSLMVLFLISISFSSYSADSTPPEVKITMGPSGTISRRNVEFKWAGEDNKTNSADLIYSYKLMNKDDEWTNWGYETQESYAELEKGNFTFKLRCRDGAGNTKTVSQSFTIDFKKPIADAGQKHFLTDTDNDQDENVDLNASKSRDPDGNIVNYSWRVTNKEFITGKDPSVDFPVGGYKVTVKVTDDDGFTDTDTTIINVGTGDPGDYKWWFKAEGEIVSAPGIGPNGTVYLVSQDEEEFWGWLYAINSDGNLKWKYKVENGVAPIAPTITSEGTIYIGTNMGLSAFNPDGTKKWSFNLGVTISSSPAIGSDGTIYMGTSNNYMYALNPNGTKKWKFDFEGSYSLDSSPAVGKDGTIYIGAKESLYAINPNGTKKMDF